MQLSHHQLFSQLEISSQAPGVFGICYSILNWSGIAKGLSPNRNSIAHSAFKLIESGHATTFLWVKSNDGFVKSHMCLGGWAFNREAWARSTPNATTYVYYVDVDQEFIDRYVEVAKRLLNTAVTHSLTTSNTPGQRSYENCVSASHHLMAELGLGGAFLARGIWTPSVANWMNWFSSFAPKTVTGATWKYRSFPNTNTFDLEAVDLNESIAVVEGLRRVPLISLARIVM